MSTKDETVRMRKNNMKIFPLYKRITWDFLFYYTIDFLFFTQVKHFSAAQVVLKASFYSLFKIILQFPASIIVEFLGRKNSLVLGNILNCLYMVIIIMTRSIGDLIFAEFICAMAFSLKNIAEPSLLNESIPPTKNRSKIYAKISAKGISGFYFIDAISKIIAGFLFAINGYLPIICSFSVLIIGTIVSMLFIEPVKKTKNEKVIKEQISDIKDGFKYVLKSNRLKALMLSSSFIYSLFVISQTYHVSLMEDLNFSSTAIGFIAAGAGLLSAFVSSKQDIIHKTFRNKTLTILSIVLASCCLIGGIYGICADKLHILFAVIVMAFLTYEVLVGLYYSLIDRYLTNFTNEKIDTKIFAANELCKNIVATIMILFGAFLLDKMITAYCMIIIGVLFLIIYVLIAVYMKSRVGLNPNEYSKEETKYDEQKKQYTDVK